jgi:predicted nucleic acid-binding protein
MDRGVSYPQIPIKRVMLDINFAADAFLKRQDYITQTEAILAANEQREIICYKAAYTVPTLFYIIRSELKKTMTRGQAEARAFTDVTSCLRIFRVTQVTHHELTLALSYPGRDYEDKLQLACAVSQKVDAIITRDKKFVRGYVTLLTPEELLKRIR